MRYLTMALALGFALGGVSVAQACSFMNAGKTTPSTIASNDGASSTKILIPAPAKPATKG